MSWMAMRTMHMQTKVDHALQAGVVSSAWFGVSLVTG